MAGGYPYGPDEDEAIRTLPLEQVLAMAASRGWPQRTLQALTKRRSNLGMAARMGGPSPVAPQSHRDPHVEAGGGVDESIPQFSVTPRNERRAPANAQMGGEVSVRSLPYDDLDAPPRLRENSTDEELWDYLESAFERRSGDSQNAPVVRHFRGGPVGVAFISDVHVGGGGVDLKRFRADLNRIDRTPNLYGVFNGDLLENTKPQLKSATALYSAQFANPKEQYGYAASRMALCRDKWLVICQGNHDAFDYRVAGIDRLEMLAHQLGVPYRTEAGATIKLTVGEQQYVIIAKHDHKGKSQLNKSNSQRRLWDEWPHEWDNADVVALAHLHEPLVEHVMRKGREVVYLRSGSYKVVDAWAESGGYKPSYGVPVVVFWPNERKLLAFPGSMFEDACAYLSSLVE